MSLQYPAAHMKPAPPWYALTTIAPDLVQITEPHVHPMLRSNIWWIRGRERDVVIDSGLGVVPLKTAIPEMFERDPLLVVTHSHLDHSGGAHEFSEVAIHENEVGNLARPEPTSLETLELYTALGIPVDDSVSKQRMLSLLPHPRYRLDEYRLKPAWPSYRLQDGDILRTADVELEILAAPGHSPGSICVLDKSKRRLYTGDVVYEGLILDDIRGSSRADYVRTMSMLIELDVDVVFPGHGSALSQMQLRQIAGDYISKNKARSTENVCTVGY